MKLGAFDVPSPAGSCQLYRDLASDKESVFWYVSFTATHMTPGKYPIVPELAMDDSGDHAEASLVQVKSGEKADRYSAIGGLVQIDEVPQDSAEWKQGMRLEGNASLEFPLRPLRPVSCEVGGPVAGPTTGQCLCQSESGETITCTLTPGESNCCARGEGEDKVRVDLKLMAEPCAEACGATPGNERYCLDL